MDAFARDMRAIRRARAAHWKEERNNSTDQHNAMVLSIYTRALDTYMADALPSTLDGQQQNWDFALASALDAHASNDASNDASKDALNYVRAFITARPVPDIQKSIARLRRRVLIEWCKTEKIRPALV